jgi:pimeloyl-ACP methyl ester carboxylesterase
MERLRPEEMFPAGVPGMTARSVQAGDVRLRLVESGPEEGRPVLLLHGWGASAYMHRYALFDLAAAGYRAIAVDLQGHGLSDKPVGAGALYRAERLLHELECLLEILALGDVAVVGQSMGGGLALRLAHARRERVLALGLISPAGLCSIPAARIGRRISPRVLDRFASFMVPRWLVARMLRLTFGDPTLVTERDIDEYWAPSRDPDFARAMRALVCEFDWEAFSDERLQSLRVPTLLILGTLDRLIPGVVNGAARMPHARTVILGGGHNVNEELHGRVNSELLRFLSSVRWP